MDDLFDMPLSFTSTDPFTLQPDVLYGGFGFTYDPSLEMPLNIDALYQPGYSLDPLGLGGAQYVDQYGNPVFVDTAVDYGGQDMGDFLAQQDLQAQQNLGLLSGGENVGGLMPTYSVTGYGVAPGGGANLGGNTPEAEAAVNWPTPTFSVTHTEQQVPDWVYTLPTIHAPQYAPEGVLGWNNPVFHATGIGVNVPPSTIDQIPMQPLPTYWPQPGFEAPNIPISPLPTYWPQVSGPSGGGASLGGGGKRGGLPFMATKYSAPKPGPFAPVVGSRSREEKQKPTVPPPPYVNPLNEWYPYMMALMAQRYWR